MLVHVFLPQEANMSKQLSLFDPRTPIWVQQLWDRIDAERRRQILSILSTMARTSLASTRLQKPKEAANEPK
jgi:hypothetical protein